MALHYSTKRWQDQVILLLGLWLIASPWVMGYPSDAPPTTNAVIAGIIMAAMAAFDLYKTYVWAVVLNLVVGAWVAVSPWLIDVMRGVLQDRAMMASLIATGVATVILGLWELRTDPELHQQWCGTGTAG
jgi:predicted MFS family arabinose efflux permease